MKTKLKFEDLKVGDVVVDNSGSLRTIAYTDGRIIVTCDSLYSWVYNKDLWCIEEGVEMNCLVDYYKPTPTRDDVFLELIEGLGSVYGAKAYQCIHALGEKKIKILFNIKD